MPRPPKTKALAEALEKLQATREDFTQASVLFTSTGLRSVLIA
jgi:hypothetical protein